MTSRFCANATSAALLIALTFVLATPSGLALSAQDHSGHDHGKAAQKPAKQEFKGDPYLLDLDPVSGKALGPVDKQVISLHEGRELRFSSQENADAFKTDPQKYLSAVDEKLIQQQTPFYPLDTCVVSGDKLGEKDAAYSFVYRNRLVRLSSKDHLAAFLKEPNKYVEKLDQAVIAKQKPAYAASTCVVSGEEFGGDMGAPVDHVVGNRLVRFCCKACKKDFNQDPLKYLAKLDRGGKEEGAQGGSEKATSYTCPMHPDVVKDKPGRCPKCGMDLVAKADRPGKGERAKGESEKAMSYTCPMHPDVVKDKPGQCSKCGMNLVQKK